jgi:hypothetical protein
MDVASVLAVVVSPFVAGLIAALGSARKIGQSEERIAARFEAGEAAREADARLQAERQNATNEHLGRINGSVADATRELGAVKTSIAACQAIQQECRRERAWTKGE